MSPENVVCVDLLMKNGYEFHYTKRFFHQYRYISNDGRRILMVVEQFGNEEVDIFQNPAILMSFLSIKYRLSVIKYLLCVLFFLSFLSTK